MADTFPTTNLEPVVPPPSDEESRISAGTSAGIDPTITDFDYSNFDRISFSPEYFANIMKMTGGDYAEGKDENGEIVRYPVNQIFAIQAADEFNSRYGMGTYEDFRNGTSKFQPGLKFTDEMILEYLTDMEDKGFFNSAARRLVSNVPSTAAFGASFAAGQKVQQLLPTAPPVRTGFPRIDRVLSPASAIYNTGKFSLPLITGIAGSAFTSIYADEPFAEYLLGEKAVPTPDSYSTMRAGEAAADILSFTPYAYAADKASTGFVSDYLINRFRLNNDLYGQGFSFDPSVTKTLPISRQIKDARASATAPRRPGQSAVVEGQPYMGPLSAAQLSELGVAQVLQGKLPPAHLRRLSAIEDALRQAGEGARENKKLTAFYDILAAGGAGLFVRGAAESDPMGGGETTAEVLSGILVPFGAQTVLTARSKVTEPIIKLVKNIRDQGLIDGTTYTATQAREGARNRRGVNEILKQLYEIGQIQSADDLKPIIEALEQYKPQFNPDGTPIKKTAGQVTKDPAIQAMEAALAREYDSLNQAQVIARQQEIKSYEDLLDALAFGEGTDLGKEAAIAAAGVREILFERTLNANLRSAEDKVLAAFDKIGKSRLRVKNTDGTPLTPDQIAELDSADMMDLSDRLFDLLQVQMRTGREQGSRLYDQVGNLMVDQFFLEDGTPTNIPTFVALLKDEGPFIRQSEIKAQLGDLFSFAQQTSDDLNLGLFFTDEGSALSAFTKAFNRIEDTNTRDNLVQFLEDVAPSLDGQLMPERVSEDLIQSVLGRAELLSGSNDSASNLLNLYARALQERRGVDETEEALSTVSLDSLRQIRKQALSKARNGDLSPESRRLAGMFAEAINDDLVRFGEFGDTSGTAARQVNALRNANAYHAAFSDVFYRSFVGDALSQTKEGRYRIAPETLGESFRTNRFDPNFLKIRDIQAVGDFLTDNKIPGAEGTISSVNGVLDRLLRQARYEAYDPDTKTYNQKNLEQWLKRNQRLQPLFPQLFDDLANFENAKATLDAVDKRNNKLRQTVNKQINFSSLLYDSKGQDRSNPTAAIAEAFAAGKDQAKALDRLFAVIPKANQEKAVRVYKLTNPETGFESTYFSPSEVAEAKKGMPSGAKTRVVDLKIDRQEAIEGFQASLFEYLIYGTPSGKGARTIDINPARIYNDLFEKKIVVQAPGARTGRSKNMTMANFLKSRGVMSERQLESAKTALEGLINLKVGQQGLDLIENFEEAKPLLDFALSISGSAIGTKTQKIISGGDSGPGALIAAGKGAEAMRNIFLRMPQHAKMLFTADLLQDPKLLAKMLRTYGPDGEKSKGVAGAVFDYLKKQGYVDLPRRAVAGSGEEVPPSEEGFDPRKEFDRKPAIPKPPVTAPVPNPDDEASLRVLPTNPPVAQPRPAAAPAQFPQTPPSPQPASRSRYAALFPNDPISDMINSNQGIGSLL